MGAACATDEQESEGPLQGHSLPLPSLRWAVPSLLLSHWKLGTDSQRQLWRLFWQLVRLHGCHVLQPRQSSGTMVSGSQRLQQSSFLGSSSFSRTLSGNRCSHLLTTLPESLCWVTW